MMGWQRHKWMSLCLLVIALGAFMLYLYGFFPLKYHSGKLAHMDDLPNFIDGVSIDGHEVYNAGEHSVVLMVIDSLRYDFVTEEYMPFTADLLKNKSACIYVSVAEPPTVTMPRIKSPERKILKAQWRRTINFWRDIFAMMTGSVSTFADVALNFGAPAVQGDSVLRVAAARGRRNVMFGDDTWLRLFPGLWAESDGTTSFYVTDYTEVDNNVTRHLDRILTVDEETKKPRFDFLVLHYLGLDHIGHLEGARSPKVKPKLAEMDNVVKKIFTAMQKWERPGVVLVCGDHGMRDAGGHGGATPAEVLVPLVLAKSRDFECPHPLGPGPTVEQVDLAPSIAWLLNAPPPGDSTGRVLPALMPRDTRQALYLLHVLAAHNARETAMPTDTEFYKQFERAEKQFAHYLATGQQSAAKIAKEFYEESLAQMAKYLSESTVNFDTFTLVVASVLIYFIASALGYIAAYSLQPVQRKMTCSFHKPLRAGVAVAYVVIGTASFCILTTACFISETKSKLCSFEPWWTLVFILIALTFAIVYVIIKSAFETITDLSNFNELNAIDYLLIGGTMFHAFSFFGTSFIEEEHMTWYFFWNTLMLFVLVRTIVVLLMYLGKLWTRATDVQEKPDLHKKMDHNVAILPKWIALIALHRYLRTMNQTGDRWLFLPDTADWLNEPKNFRILEAHMVLGTLATLVICIRNLKYTNNILQMHTAFTVLSTLCILAYRVASKSLDLPLEDVKSWDTVTIVNVLWGLIIAQFVFEVLTYVGNFRLCGISHRPTASSTKFVYKKPKAKTEDYFYDEMVEEPWNLKVVKLNFVRSISHLMLNNMMLVVILLMRPHNVIMVPSIYLTCVLASEALDHKLLDTTIGRNTDAIDDLSLTLAHLWIGAVFFFYQGNSNSLASVDLGAGYVGLRAYSAARVAARMGLHAYAGPALAGAALFCRLPARAATWDEYIKSVWRAGNIFAFQRAYTLAIYSIVTNIFRDHLFVWSVFSPKLLYDFVGCVFTIQALATIAGIVASANVTSWVARMVTHKSRL